MNDLIRCGPYALPAGGVLTAALRLDNGSPVVVGVAGRPARGRRSNRFPSNGEGGQSR